LPVEAIFAPAMLRRGQPCGKMHAASRFARLVSYGARAAVMDVGSNHQGFIAIVSELGIMHPAIPLRAPEPEWSRN
jgi:hypothetical protein